MVTLIVMAGGPLEKDTCRDYVLPRLKAAGWDDDQIVEQFPITDGRVITVGKKHRRAEALRDAVTKLGELLYVA
ncbi:MAG: hypothetical protein WD770_03855 [Actinomycetota bacterium]